MTGGAGKAWRWLFVAVCALWLAAPFAVLHLAAWSGGAFEHHRAPSEIERERLSGLLAVSVRIMAGTTLLAVLLGVTVALAVHRARGWWGRLLACLYPGPLLIPATVVAQAWVHLAGKRGLGAALWDGLTGAKQLPFSMYGEGGTAWILAFCWFPLVTLPTLVGLRAGENQGIPAARVFAGCWPRFWKIELPLLLPYVSAGAVFVAWLALGDFEVPPVLLTNTYPLQIYGAVKAFELGRALALALPLLGLAALVLAARQVLTGSRTQPTIDTRWRSGGPAPAPLGAGGVVLQATVAVILLLATVAPILSLAHQAEGWVNIRKGLETAGPQILNSFKTACAAAALLLAMGAPFALLLGEARGWRRAALALLAVLPLALPATLHGLAWTEALKCTAWGRALLDSPYVVSLSDAARFFPFSVFLLLAAFEGLDRKLFDAARASGAGAWRRATGVGWPLLWPGFAAAFAIGFALSLGELGATILLNPVGTSTLPVRLSSLLHFGKDELLASLCLIQIFLALLPYAAALIFLERRLEARFG